jgi:hypothetical protein
MPEYANGGIIPPEDLESIDSILTRATGCTYLRHVKTSGAELLKAINAQAVSDGE